MTDFTDKIELLVRRRDYEKIRYLLNFPIMTDEEEKKQIAAEISSKDGRRVFENILKSRNHEAAAAFFSNLPEEVKSNLASVLNDELRQRQISSKFPPVKLLTFQKALRLEEKISKITKGQIDELADEITTSNDAEKIQELAEIIAWCQKIYPYEKVSNKAWFAAIPKMADILIEQQTAQNQKPDELWKSVFYEMFSFDTEKETIEEVPIMDTEERFEKMIKMMDSLSPQDRKEIAKSWEAFKIIIWCNDRELEKTIFNCFDGFDERNNFFVDLQKYVRKTLQEPEEFAFRNHHLMKNYKQLAKFYDYNLNKDSEFIGFALSLISPERAVYFIEPIFQNISDSFASEDEDLKTMLEVVLGFLNDDQKAKLSQTENFQNALVRMVVNGQNISAETMLEKMPEKVRQSIMDITDNLLEQGHQNDEAYQNYSQTWNEIKDATNSATEELSGQSEVEGDSQTNDIESSSDENGQNISAETMLEKMPEKVRQSIMDITDNLLEQGHQNDEAYQNYSQTWNEIKDATNSATEELSGQSEVEGDSQTNDIESSSDEEEQNITGQKRSSPNTTINPKSKRRITDNENDQSHDR